MYKESETKLNRDFRLVFTEKKEVGKKRKRHFVSANTIGLYIGENNVKKTLDTMRSLKVDKITLKFRAHGKLEIYSK